MEEVKKIEVPESTSKMVVKNGEDEGKEYPLEKSIIKIGRDISSEVCINERDRKTSRKHARLYLENDEYYLPEVPNPKAKILIRNGLDQGKEYVIEQDYIRIGRNSRKHAILTEDLGSKNHTFINDKIIGD
ncbi:MAG: FHA domain-containing protein, partial [Methanosarcinales archaeon]